MVRVKGIYNGRNVTLLEPVSLAPDTLVEVLIPESSEALEQAYWQQLLALGLLSERRPPAETEDSYAPVTIAGKPLSQTIIDERR